MMADAADLDVYQYAILHRLIHHADERGICWPKIGTLARDLKIGRSTVQRALKRLSAMGIIVRRPRYRRGLYTGDFFQIQPGQRDLPSQVRETYHEQEQVEQGESSKQVEIPSLLGIRGGLSE